jgi:hypothetical protein
MSEYARSVTLPDAQDLHDAISNGSITIWTLFLILQGLEINAVKRSIGEVDNDKVV